MLNILVFLLTACAGAPPLTQLTVDSVSKTPTPSQIPSSTPTITTPVLTQGVSITSLPIPSTIANQISCDDWQDWPVVPIISQSSHELYAHGIALGNDPRAFSKIGDGGISTAWFLSAFDLSTNHYNLGEHRSLASVIENFQGSFERFGFAARRGFNTQKILDPSSNNDSSPCKPDESPLDCELRSNRPSIAIISLGTNQVWQPEQFETGLRTILDVLISSGVLPILSTKGDNLEGDHRINRTIACLAQEYNIPLWNFWAAIQALPDQGLQPDLEHLTYYRSSEFDNPIALQHAWTIRNLTALQTLEAVWQSVSK